jgi:molecular chaperone DnaK
MDKALKDILLLDIIPFSLGIETIGDVMTVVVKKNFNIPLRKT